MDKSALTFRKGHWLLKILNNTFYDLPCPVNLNLWWSFGSMLGLCFVIQFVTGLLLTLHYTAHEDLAFDSCFWIMRNIKKGWLLRSCHANGASMFFFCLYIHIARGIYYGSYLDKAVWNVGVVLYLMLMAESFLGYTLPWGQMSFWGATVITEMVGAIPGIGKSVLMIYVRGSWSVSNFTLQRFYTVHFLLPFIVMVVVMMHFFYLHENGSNNPLGIDGSTMLIPFHPFYTVKDIFGFVCFFCVFMYFSCVEPEKLGNTVNFIPADGMHTPLHITPEWYFCFAYGIVKVIPHKGGGIALMFMSILVLFFLPLIHTGKFQGLCFYPFHQVIFWCFIYNFFLMTWIGIGDFKEAYPYNIIGQYLMVAHFSLLLSIPSTLVFWDGIVFD